MDRVIVYIDANPLDTDQLYQSKNTMIGLGMLIQAVLGTSTLFDGLTCAPTAPASLEIVVSPGSVYSFQNVDNTAFGSVAADETHQIVKQGISLDPVTLPCPAPGTAGYSVNYLVQAIYQDTDTGSTVVPYYNADNPNVAFDGPGGDGISQNTMRQGKCIISAKAGVAATTGSQTTPAPDAGYTGLWVVTVQNTQTQITSGNISEAASAPFIVNKLTALAPLASPALTGIPTVPTAAPGTNTTQAASTAFVQTAVGGGTRRTLMTGNMTFYISTTGDDTAGTGTSGAPWATRQHAWNTVQSTYDLDGYNVTFQLADGTYTDSLAAQGWMVGQNSPGQVIFNGDSGTPSNVVISASSGAAFGALYSAYTVQNMKAQNSGGNILFAQNGGTIEMGAGLILGASSGTKIRASYDGQIIVMDSYTDTGNAQQHYGGYDGGRVIVTGGLTVTLTGTPAYSVAFAQVTTGEILMQNTPSGVATFSGSATGSYYSANVNGVINTQGSGATYFPGNAAGTVDGSAGTSGTHGGQYV